MLRRAGNRSQAFSGLTTFKVSQRIRLVPAARQLATPAPTSTGPSGSIRGALRASEPRDPHHEIVIHRAERLRLQSRGAQPETFFQKGFTVGLERLGEYQLLEGG